MSNPHKYKVYLSEPERNALKNISRNGKSPAKKILHAQMLLLSDQNHPEGGWTDSQISEALGVHPYTVARVRKCYVTQGEVSALNRQVRKTPPIPKKLNGEQEAYLMAICSHAPEGRDRWTLSLLVDELKKHGIVTEISRETVRQSLKKNSYNLRKNNAIALHKRV